MRRSMSIALTLLVTASIAGCTPRNTVQDNVYKSKNIQNIKYSTTQTKYKDGVYVGYSDSTANGREMARVTIRNGRIVDVDLTTVVNDNQYNANIGGTNRTTTSTGTGVINTRTITGTGTNTSIVGTGNYSTGNANNGFIINSATKNSNKYSDMNTGYDITITNTGTTGTGTSGTGVINNGVHSGFGITGINSNTQNRLNTQGTLDTNQYGGLTRLRSVFTRAILENQTYNFDINNLGENLTEVTTIGSVKNWQSAVRRALDQAKK
ncbi:hypothetical protein [Clostridium thermarum]|uniref:hypothetical protein n=1 Tax=Clostridium thermarum TaxID=1716543 RepID=UPI0013D1F5E1|nr:hypothetical protein [Clostridium thermarum]